ncbi:hypothetical protein CSAL01_04920 [Colletotrichum salicis]|uniref:FAR1 domain-containing protein n=1 Tax=Colletotrichum salicis TaxID=1209931 RepID=A0A135RQG0_9PEZI|nr:hypothetical protein CSAL01_04920 [Colletotrichum salicis]
MFGILGARDRSDGTEEYASFEELFAALKTRMQKDGYKVVKSRTHRNKVGGTYEKGSEVVRCDLVCDRGGQPYKCTATQLKTSTKKTNCPWKAKAVNRKTLGKWILTIICSEHNHEARTPDPPTDEEDADAEGDADVVQDVSVVPEVQSSGPAPDPTTAALLLMVGAAPNTMRLTGETFHNFKSEDRQAEIEERNQRTMQMRGQHLNNSFQQQNAVQQTPVPVPQFGMQSAQGQPQVFHQYTATPTNNAMPKGAAGGSPATGSKRRGRPKKTAMDQSLDASLHMGR